MDVPRSQQGLSLLVVIPCLDEEKTVGRLIAGIPGDIDGIDRISVLVIDDGSSDRSAQRARDAGAEVVVHPINRGLGATFQEAVGLACARGTDILVHIDGDGQFDPADIPLLVRPIVDQEAHMATASRFLEGELLPKMPAIKVWGNRRVARIVRLLTGKKFQDVSCGFRAYSKEALLRMNLFGTFTYTQEVFLDLVFKNLSIVEMPVKVRGTREFGTSRIASSIPRYAIRSMQIMLRAFISYRPLRFFFFLGGLFGVIGMGLLSFLGLHYLRNGAFSPHIWSGFLGGSFLFLSVLTLVIGFVGDMLMRIRMNQENILYHLRAAKWEEAQTAEFRTGENFPEASRH